MSLSCPVCYKTGFTEISISTHVEYCILRASRVEAKAAADPATHPSKKKRLDRDHALPTPSPDPPLDSAATVTVARQAQCRGVPTPTPPNTDSALSVYQSTTLEDLAALEAAPRKLLPVTRPLLRGQHHQRALLGHMQPPSPPSSPLPRPDSVPPQLSPALRRAFSAHRLVPPPAASIPDSLFCSSSSSSSRSPPDNSLYLAFWEGQERAVAVVYERVLRASLAALTSSPVYCAVPPRTAGEGRQSGRGEGYGGWTEQDLRTVCAKNTLPSQPPQPPQQPQYPQERQSSPQQKRQQPPAERRLPPRLPPVEEGLAVCTRAGGGTIRDAVDIDQSSVCPYRLQHRETFHFTQLQSLPPPDQECVAVVRLFGYVERAGERLFGWASLTGRTVEDHDCILAVTNMPAWMSTHELRGVVEAALCPPPEPPPLSPSAAGKSSEPPPAAAAPAILASTNCPLCDSVFPAGMALSAREAHVNQCLLDMQCDVFSQNS